jgi:protocatechuate 4,5-dioxygenase, alpha chain
MSSLHQHRRIPGTPIFDGAAAQRGYALNRMCYSLNHADNRASLLRDADGYCRRFGWSDAQIDAVNRKNVLALLACP